jgi:hypothetical protein
MSNENTGTPNELRNQLVKMLTGEQAHLSFADAVAEFPDEHINTMPANVPYTFWHLIEHLRITQLDLLNYITKADYEEIEWPREYWPDPNATTDRSGWDQSIQQFTADLNTLIGIAQDESIDLFATVPSHHEHTVIRGLMIVGNHNSYHIGELAILRETTGTWGPSHS